MDLKQSMEFSPSSTPSSSTLRFPQATSQGNGDNGHSRPMYMHRQHLHLFWMHCMHEIRHITEIRSRHYVPLARIKRIMKSGGEVKMVTADAPILLTKACEIFTLELTLRAWLHAEDSQRQTLQRCDIARAVKLDGLLHFLVELVCSDDFMEEETGNYVEGIHSLHQAEQIHFPAMNTSNGFVLGNEVGDRFMIQQPTSRMNLVTIDKNLSIGDYPQPLGPMMEEKAYEGEAA